MNIRQMFSLASVLSSSVVILATSKVTSPSIEGNLHLISDCSGSVLEMDVLVTGGQIAQPPGVKFSDFGFPLDTLSVIATENNEIVGGNRVCKRTYANEKNEMAYSCSDGGSFVCTIFIQVL